jgi:hypothetical protein
LRRALIAAAVASAALAAAAAGSGGATVDVDPHCELTARAAPDGKAIKFRFGCSNIEPHELEFRPTTGVRGVTHYPSVKPFVPGDTFYCPRLNRGRGVRCTGHMEDGATLRGRLRPEGRLCRTEIPWNAQGGVDCDGDEVCINVALSDRGAARPRGC